MFIDKFIGIYSHVSDSTTNDIAFLPQGQRFLSVSPTSVAIWEISNLTCSPSTISIYHLPEKLQNEHGLFLSIVCPSSKHFVILTSMGQIANFELTNSSSSMKLTSFFVLNDARYTCVAAYTQNYYLVGDDQGNFMILSSDFSIVYHKNISDGIAIKSISVSPLNGLIYLADCSLFSFQINLKDINDRSFELLLSDKFEYTPSIVTTSKLVEIGAIYEPKGILRITNNFNTFNQSIDKIPGLLYMAFSNEENILVLLFRKKIGIWSQNFRRIFYISRKELVNVRMISVSKHFILAPIENVGIALYPLIYSTTSTVPLLYSANKLFVFNPTTDGIILSEHQFDNFGLIEFAVADRFEKFIAFASSGKIAIFLRNSLSASEILWFDDPRPIFVRGIEWFKDILCILSFDPSNTFFSLLMYKIGPTDKKTLILPSRPFYIKCTDEYIIIYFIHSFLLIDKNMTQKTIEVPVHLTSIWPHTNFIFGLTKNNKLVAITYDGQLSVLRENVSTFFVSQDYDLLFVVIGMNIYITSTSHFSFSVFICSDCIPIGISSPLCAYLSLQNNFSDLTLSTSFFFDYSILSNQIYSPEKAVQAMDALNSNINRKSIILQSAVFSLRQMRGKACVKFLSQFPEDFDELLISAMRSVENNERQTVYSFIGKPSEYFSMLGGLKKDVYDQFTYKFSFEEEKAKENGKRNPILKLPSLLLPIILEDEGCSVAFPAAFFLIRNVNYDFYDNYLPFFRFIEPILSRAVAIDEAHVSCVGVKMDTQVYSELRQQFEETIEFCIKEMTEQFKIQLVYQFASISKISFQKILLDNKEIFSKELKIVEIIKKIKKFVCNASSIEKFDGMVKEMNNAGLNNFSVSFLISFGNFEEVNQIVSSENELMKQIQESEWSDILKGKIEN